MEIEEKFNFNNFSQKGAQVNALNKYLQTPAMLLFIKEGEDEIINTNNKFDPIRTLMVFRGIDLSITDIFRKNILHYACIRGSTISIISILENNFGPKLSSKFKIFVNKINSSLKDYSGTTPLGYALKNKHEGVCIHLIQ